MDELLARRLGRDDFWTGVTLADDGSFALQARLRKPCCEYQNGCVCGCKPKPKEAKRRSPRQPWELAA